MILYDNNFIYINLLHFFIFIIVYSLYMTLGHVRTFHACI